MVLAPKQPKAPALHHRKRHGNHHKQNKPYHNTYWPYLPLLAIAGLAFLINLAWPAFSLHQGAVLGTSSGLTTQELLVDTNEDRTKDNKQPLEYNNKLEKAAQKKAQDMASRDYWSHISPDSRQPWDFAKAAGYTYESLGENLAYGFSTTDGVISGWMNSEEHRLNMLDASFSQVGFGVVRAADFQGKGPQTIVVAMYGEPAPTLSVSATVINTNEVLPARTVARADQIAGAALPGVSYIIAAIAGIGMAVFIARHLRFLHRLVVQGETFVIKHPHLDILIVSVTVLSVLLTRTAGYVH